MQDVERVDHVLRRAFLAGMGDQETYEITQLIRKLHREQKLTIVLIEHDMDLVFSFADRISVLVAGKLLVEGAPEQVARDARVKAVYLGEATN